jgi:hypothetical protein
MNRHRALAHCLSMISAQTLRVCREEKPLHAFPDHAVADMPEERAMSAFAQSGHGEFVRYMP